MDIQNLVNQVLFGEMKTLGAEPCDFGGVTIDLILAETRSDLDIYGGERPILSLTGTAPTTAITEANIKEQGFAIVRGKRMKVASVSKGKSMISVDLEEAAKVKR
jgi:hypothetical protein